jgi:hypothetical protein
MKLLLRLAAAVKSTACLTIGAQKIDHHQGSQLFNYLRQ